MGRSRIHETETILVPQRASLVEIPESEIIYLTFWSRELNRGVEDTATYFLRPYRVSHRTGCVTESIDGDWGIAFEGKYAGAFYSTALL